MFNYSLETNLIFGFGAADKIGEASASLGKRALIVTGGSSTKKSGLLSRVTAQLEKKGVEAVLYDGVKQNPLISTVREGASLLVKEGCDHVIALGGGSIMDAAKSMAMLSISGGDFCDYLYGRKAIVSALPTVMVPTTCGTGSEVNSIAVITNEDNGDKKGYRAPALAARYSIVDPALMMTLPRGIFSAVSFDALAHLMEGYLSRRANPITRAQALQGIRLIGESLMRVYNRYDEKEGWEKVTLASTLGGYTLESAGVIAPHALEHPLSGLRNIAHGVGLAAILPAIFDEFAESCKEQFSVIAEALCGDPKQDLVMLLKEVLCEMKLAVTLSELGFEDGDIEWLSNSCLQVSPGNIQNSPLAFTKEEIRKIYKKAMTFNKEEQ